MPTYELWYSESYTYKAWFDADNKEEAIKLLEKVQNGDLIIDDLPEFGRKDKGYELDIEPSEVEEL